MTQEQDKINIESMEGEDSLRKMFPDRTTEEVVHEIVSANPLKHGVSLESRIKAANAQAAIAARDFDAYERRFRARVAELGGDPEETLGGNRMRYTLDEETGDVKDHATGAVHRAKQAGEPIQVVVGAGGVEHADHPSGGAAAQGSPDSKGADGRGESPAPKCQGEEFCTFQEPVTEATKCSKCGLTFKAWVEI